MSDAEARGRMRDLLAAATYRRRNVTFVLGTDEDILRERRVALVPEHLIELREDLAVAGLELRVLALRGAGDRAGFGDGEYRDAGAELIDRDDLAAAEDVDVFHALKEPTPYESSIPGPFLRLGALHLASLPPGVCELLRIRSFAAILDGGTVGGCSFLRTGADRTPIVASMSRFAGAVSGRKLVAGLDARGHGPGKIVIVGGGIAGLAAIGQLRAKIHHLVVVERYAPTRDALPAKLRKLGLDECELVPELTDEVMRDAVGIVFAHRSGAKAAEKVCSFDQIRLMKPGAGIVDIAIDQGGSIRHDGYLETDDAHTARRKYQALLADYFYYAETNMPREVPREASILHGDASLPYVTLLLALCAQLGGPQEVARELLRRRARTFVRAEDLGDESLLGCLLQDLRNGCQLAVVDGEAVITDPDIERNDALSRWVRDCSLA